MSKNFMRLVPLLAIAAILVVPAAAQAAPHYTAEGATLEAGDVRTVEAWGTITLASIKPAVGANITCHNAAAGIVENSGGIAGPVGTGQTEVFVAYQCEQENVCPPVAPFPGALAENLPWTAALQEEKVGTIRQEATKEGKGSLKVKIQCFVDAGHTVEGGHSNQVTGASEKGQRPNSKKGTSALHPGFLEFGEGSGILEEEGSNGAKTGKTQGTVKTQGYNAQELMGTRNP